MVSENTIDGLSVVDLFENIKKKKLAVNLLKQTSEKIFIELLVLILKMILMNLNLIFSILRKILCIFTYMT